MTLQRRLFCQSAALGLAGAALPSAFAATDPFPSKPIRIVVPYPAGGLTDTVARHAANGASPACQFPVPAESTIRSSRSRPASARRAPSASGERQMLPRQTKRTL